jgi:hypothetical protein
MTHKRHYKYGLFLCHSKKDILLVRQFAKDLKRLHVMVWLDEWELAPGDSLHGVIARALEESRYVSVFVSRASLASRWVAQELNAALAMQMERKRSLVIPVRLDDVAMPGFLKDKLYVDLNVGYWVAITRLVAHIKGLDQQRIMERLSTTLPDSIDAVEVLLGTSGAKEIRVIGSVAYHRVTKELERVLGERIVEDSFHVLSSRGNKGWTVS